MKYLDQPLNLFPDVSEAEESGLLAIGGSLSPERLIYAYANGIFPWYLEGEPIYWYAPPERCVIYPDMIKVNRQMEKLLRSYFEIRMNTVFSEVIHYCKNIERVGQEGTWITDAMEEAYINLHRLGHAQSIEVFHKNELVGGLYGVVVNQVFCGESMFSKISNASKAALIFICRSGLYKLIDCQVQNEHLLSLGATIISRETFMEILQSKTTE